MNTGAGRKCHLRLAGTGFDFAVNRLVIAGYTGADRERTRRHIDELAALGVPPPPSVPMFYEIPSSLLTFDSTIAVPGAETSGEVEPVLFCDTERWYVGLGSDHTARDIEREDVERSKTACPKVASRDVLAYDVAEPYWNALWLRSRAGEGEPPYQDAALSELLPPADILAAYRDRGGGPLEGLVMFLGTVPTREGRFVFSDTFAGQLMSRSGESLLTCSYRVSRRG